MEKKSTVFTIGWIKLLTLLFIGLKLTGHIAWSWWLVLSPLLLPIGLMVILVIIAGVIALIDQ